MSDYMNGALCSALVEVSHDAACTCFIPFFVHFITYLQKRLVDFVVFWQKPSGETEAISLLLVCSSGHQLLLLWYLLSLELQRVIPSNHCKVQS